MSNENKENIPEILRINYGFHDNKLTFPGRLELFFNKKFPDINPKTILDAGCSNGYTTFDLADHYKEAEKIIGVDQYKERLLKIPDLYKDRVSLFAKDFFSMKLPDEDINVSSFDAVFGLNNFYYKITSTFPQILEKRVNQFKKLTNDNGHLIIGAELGNEFTPNYYVLQKKKQLV